MGPEMAPLARVKATERRAAHGAEVGHLSILADEVAGLDRDLHLGGGLLQVVEHLGAVGELVELRVEQLRQPSARGSRRGCASL